MGFTIFRAAMTALICCFLVMLFLLPSAVLREFSAQADALMEQAENALLLGDPEAAKPYCAELRDLVCDRMSMLERFLNHESVDALDARVAVADFALRTGDAGAAAEALAEARSILLRIEGIELFSWNNLL